MLRGLRPGRRPAPPLPLLCAAAGALLLAGACGSTSRAERVTALPKADTSALGGASPEERFAAEMKRGDAHFAKRDQLPELEKAIAAYQSAAKINPRSPAVWARLSRCLYLKADGFLSFEKGKGDAARRRYLETHEQGIVYAKRAMIAHSEDFRRRIEAGTKIEDAVAVLGKEAVPALYWYASNYGKWAVEKGFATILKYKDMIRKVMTHVLKLDPDFYFGAADRYFGVFYAKAPSFAGGDMGKSKTHFERSLKKAPGYFATKVLMAKFYARKMDDRALFERLLKEVLEGDPMALPPAAPENRIEQRKAKALLAQIDEYF